MKKSSNTVLIKWKDVTKLKVSLLRKLTKISCLPWFKSHALEIFDTQGNNLVQSKSLSEFRKADKKPDSYNEYGSDGDSVLSRLRYLFQVSEQVLTWRFEYIVPIYYVMKQPNPFFESTLFRLSTYSKWPPKAPQIFSSYLVDAGFYFDQNSEEILCFSCGLCINVSELEYHSSRCSVLQMHLQYSEKCEYALNKMREISGSDTIDGRQPAVPRDELECSNVELARSNGHSQLNSFVPVVPEKEEYSSMAQVASTTEKDFSYSSMQFAQPTSDEDAVPLCVSSSHQEVVLPSIHLMQKDLSYGQKSRQQNAEVSAAGMPRVYNYDLKHPEYKETEKRMKSFRTPNTPQILIMKMYDIVVAGFFFTGESDIVRCFCCDMGLAEWMEEDVPWEEHAKHSPRCPYLIEEMGEEFISRVQAQWSRIYSPKHPAYTEYNLRLESFRTFPEYVTQRRDEIAAAGFFYTGELDIVRCHYCDGGLRDWEPGDEPWLEHAKWFPFCKYLLKVKGRDYVENAVSSNIEEV
ncbi:hypothetical protein FSP39_015077 [Pinctada imbricata]|uniref:Uncharacterized protein n=1 Tax=Pinctada imbricata TaxID=66713 RepID=A0AA88YEN7_PINIB|nr:hypothetical protein FSP39_015077 [Pinctada imbricata]